MITWSEAYVKGYNASRRADVSGAAYEDGDAQGKAQRRYELQHGTGQSDAWVTGWNDQAVGNDYDTAQH